jgi:hypothetical protein
MRVRLAAIVLVLGAGCGGGDDGFGMGVPEVDCSLPIPSFSQVEAFPHTCNQCHTVLIADDDPRRDAPPGMNFDVYDSAVDNAERSAITVNEGTMPLSGGIIFSEKQDLYLWALCGTPP